MGTFEKFYNTSIQQPLLLWIGLILAIMFVAIKLNKSNLTVTKSNLGKFILFWISISAIDAWLTANRVIGFGSLQPPYSNALPTLFVIIGDFRVFLLVHLICASENMNKKSLVVLGNSQLFLYAFLWSLPVPLVSFTLVSGLLSKYISLEVASRILFLFYELLFILWILIFRHKVSKLLIRDPLLWGWAKSIIHFSIFYYGLWASADLWILALDPAQIQDFGFLLRCLPNLLYYAGWTPCVVWGYYKYQQPVPWFNQFTPQRGAF